MPSRKSELDEPFFREWRARRPGEKRSLSRARSLLERLALHEMRTPVLVVVGSKGKATTAVYAAATLAARGLKIGLLTSPPILENRERIRVDGTAMSEDAYGGLSQRLGALLDAMPSGEGRGYLSPTGLFTLLGARHMLDRGCDVLVLEAGIGGRSDEVSLFSPLVVAMSQIFAEHAELLGPTVADIARDKAGVIVKTTRVVFSLPQSDEVMPVIEERARTKDAELAWVTPDDARAPAVPNARGLSVDNARLGIRAASRLADLLGADSIDEDHLDRTLATVTTPGRLSEHADERGRTWIADAGISGDGAAAALRYCAAHGGLPTTIFVSIPDTKDVAGVRSAVERFRYFPVALDEEHLSFSSAGWGRELIAAADMERHIAGDRILAMGTWSFVSIVLERLRLGSYAAFTVPAVTHGRRTL